jgi:hypothetical protein
MTLRMADTIRLCSPGLSVFSLCAAGIGGSLTENWLIIAPPPRSFGKGHLIGPPLFMRLS